jgi:hypothetical protein
MRALTVTALLLATACKGPPARLAAGNSDTVVVNNVQPVRIPMRVLDRAGRLLDSTGVRFARMSGVPVPVTEAGVVTCTDAGDAWVRATLGEIHTDVMVRCRPVHKLSAQGSVDIVVGDSAQDLALAAFDTTGRPVTLFAGIVRVHDTTVASIEGLRIRPVSPGQTFVDLKFGDRATSVIVNVYERASTPVGIRPNQNLVVPVRVPNGELRQWPLAAGQYILSMRDDPAGRPRPRLAIVGANCTPMSWEAGWFCLSRGDASVIVYSPWQAKPAPDLSGELAVRRISDS